MLHSRMARVAELIKEEIGEIIDRDVEDPNLPEFITIHSVKVAKDLHHAEVFVTFLQDEGKGEIDTTIGALNKAARFIRGELGRRIRLKYMPELHFRYNPSTRYAAKLETLFHEIESAAPIQPVGGEETSAEPQ